MPGVGFAIKLRRPPMTPDPEAVERVARAIAAAKRAPEQRTPEIIERVWRAYCGQARAAIDAFTSTRPTEPDDATRAAVTSNCGTAQIDVTPPPAEVGEVVADCRDSADQLDALPTRPLQDGRLGGVDARHCENAANQLRQAADLILSLSVRVGGLEKDLGSVARTSSPTAPTCLASREDRTGSRTSDGEG